MSDNLEFWADMLNKRNNKLSACDWTQTADSPLSDSKKQSGLLTDKRCEIFLILYAITLITRAMRQVIRLMDLLLIGNGLLNQPRSYNEDTAVVWYKC